MHIYFIFKQRSSQTKINAFAIGLWSYFDTESILEYTFLGTVWFLI